MTPNDELRRLAEAATPGEWEVYSEPDVGMPPALMALRPSGDRVIKFFRDPIEPLSRQDLEFVAAASPARILALLDEVEALKRERDEAKLQPRVKPWLLACFGEEISADKVERRHRFLEEALELFQAVDGTEDEADQLARYVFGRPKGEPHQEVGGVEITLAALCLAHDFDKHKAGEDELARIWTKVEQIRAKQAAKPKSSVLPVATERPHP